MPAAGFIDCPGPIGCEVRRREPPSSLDMTPASLNVRVLEKVYPHRAPEPIHDGDTPARPARMQIAVFQAIAPILSVMKDIYQGDALWAPINNASTTTWVGGHTRAVGTWDERVNVRRTPSMPYGTALTLDSDDKYNLLMGAR